MNRVRVAALAAVVVLNACSGGGSNGGVPPATHVISGNVSGAVAEGVTVSLTGAATATTTSDANGDYSFGGLANGDYVVAPSMAGYAFTPVSIAVTVNGADVVGQDFTATAAANTHSISGIVSGAVAAGVTIVLDGANTGSTITGADGSYSFTGLGSGSYTLTPALGGYAFSPQWITVTVTVADVTGQDFTATAIPSTFAVSGTVRGAATQGVTISLGGAASRTTTTDQNGNYTFGGLANGAYTLAASMGGYSFSPNSITVSVNGADVTGQDFTASTAAVTYSISGTVTDGGSGNGLSGVTLTLSGSNTGTAVTDPNGDYSFTGLSNGSYKLTPSLAGYTFDPGDITPNVNGADVAGQDFLATAIQGTYTISGTVSGDVSGGVTITLGGAATATTTTRADGTYSFTGLSDGTYTLTPSTAGFVTFDPAMLTVLLSGADATGRDFIATLSTQTLSIVTPFLPGGRVGRPYAATIYAWGGTQPYVFAGVGLPTWLTLAADGSLSGTPDAKGTFTFTVTVTDANTATANRDLAVTVR